MKQRVGLIALLFFLPLLLQTCRNSPQIFIDTTYLQTHNIKRPHANALDALSDQTIDQRVGVYWPHFYAIKKYPALVIKNSRDQLEFIMLDDSLDLPFGDFVRLTGVPVDSVIPLGHSYEKSLRIFQVTDYQIERDTHKLLGQAQKDYQFYKAQLNEQAVQIGSKLKWPEQPEWQLFVDEQRSKVVLFFSAADLMYAVDVNFVYNLENYDLVQIYAREWFKGE